MYVAGAGPEQVQLHKTRARAAATLAGGAQGLTFHPRGARIATKDVRSPQTLIEHPRITQADVIESSLVAAEAPRLPGRVPPAGWDGEPGYSAPQGY
jgi:hypothetical protein